MFYTYAHYRPDGRIFYIGKGSGNRYASVGRSRHWKNIVAKEGGFSSEILARWSSEAEAFEHEKFLIKCFRDLGFDLCNLTDGGEGVSGRIVTDETRNKLRQFGNKNGMFGIIVSDETRLRMSVASKKTMSNPETRAKIGLSSQGRKHTEEAKSKIKCYFSDPETRSAHGAAIKAGWAKRKQLQIAEGACV